MATATLNDMTILATDQTFQGRVAMSLYIYCWNTVPNEAISATTLAQHVARKSLAGQILLNPGNFTSRFTNVVAANQTVANDATTNGTLVGLATSAIASAALLCTDTDINNAVAASFNAFISNI